MRSNSSTNVKRFVELLDELDPLEAAMLCVEIIIFIPSVFGNGLILISIHRFKWLQTPLNALVGNLALSDLLTGLCLIPIHVVGTFFGLNKLENVCLLNLMVLVTLLLVTLLSMLAISVERYYSVAFPWKHRASRRHLFVKLFIPLCWILTICFSVLPLFDWNNFTGSDDNKCQLYTVWPDTLKYILNSTIIFTITVQVILFSLVVNITLNRLPSYKEQEAGVRMRSQLTKTYTLMAISAIFILCWAPFCVISLFILIVDMEDVKIVQIWMLNLGLLNSALNWLIYGLKNEKFRKAFKLILCKTPATRPVSLESVGEVSSQ